MERAWTKRHKIAEMRDAGISVADVAQKVGCNTAYVRAAYQRTLRQRAHGIQLTDGERISRRNYSRLRCYLRRFAKAEAANA